MTDETVRDLEAFPFDEELENEQLGKPADTPTEGISALQKRHALPLEIDILGGSRSSAKETSYMQAHLATCRMQGVHTL